MLLLTCLIACLATVDDPEVELVSALARRGWIDLAGELCARIEKLPGASLALAEVASARARQEPDAARAVQELDAAIARLGGKPSLDDRGMAGALHVQKARLLNEPRAWEAVEAYYKGSIAALEKRPDAEDALLDARLELAKAVAARARTIADDEVLRKKLLTEAERLFVDFQFDTGDRPIAYEALLEEGRVRVDLREFARAERCFRAVLAVKAKSEYLSSLKDAAHLALLKLLSVAGKGKDAVAAADLFLKQQPARVRTGYGIAVQLARAEALQASGAKLLAIAAAQAIVALDPDGPGGAEARNLIRELTKDGGATADQLLLIADGLMDRGLYKDALVELRRSVEVGKGAVEAVAAFKRGECFQALKREVEASLSYQEVFRKYPKHELAQRAAFEAVRALIRSAAITRDRRDEAQQEALLKEIKERGVQGAFAGYFSFLEAELLERQGKWKAAADLYMAVDETCEVYVEALVSAGHCLRRDGEARGLQTAERLLRLAVSRLEKAANPRLLASAQFELATILLQARPKEALEFIERCAKPLPPESEMLPRLAEMEIRARLTLDDVAGAVARLDRLLSAATGPAVIRSARRVAVRLERTDPAKSARYYRAWLDATETEDAEASELKAVADGADRMARAVNRLDDKVFSILDLRGKPVADRGVWKDVARAQVRVLSLKGLSAEEQSLAESRLACSRGLSAESADDWVGLKKHVEGLIAKYTLVGNQGLNAAVLQKQPWLAGIYLEYGHALYQLGKAGEKFQYANALTVFGNFVEVAATGSEPWWVCKAMSLRILFERGDGLDLKKADAGISNLERNHPDFDGGKYGMAPVLVELREQIRISVGLRR